MPVLLFLTSPEMGQANSHAAVLDALAEMQDPNLELHIASYEGLKTPLPSSVTRHTLVGQGLSELGFDKVDEPGADRHKIYSYFVHSPGFWSNLKFITHHSWILHPESASQYIETTLDIIRLIEKLQPDICIVDPFFCQAHDASKRCGKGRIILHPLDTRHVALADQGAGMFKLPPPGTGFRYPMSLLDSVYTIYTFIFSILWYFFLDSHFRAITKARHQAGFPGPLPLLVPPKDKTLLMSSDPALEYPVIVPEHIAPCGPILLPADPVEQVDPELSEWLKKGPVILIVLGSHVMYSRQELEAFQQSLEVVLRQHPDLRLLWKVVKLDKVDISFEGIDEERVRIVDWLKPMPVAVLQTGQVALFVHHGGSNSYHEALATGTPQTVLSSWADCHDNAQTVEWLGVGVWGNRKAAPGYKAPELTRAFTAVLGSSSLAPEAERIKAPAEECKALINAHWTKLAAGRSGKQGQRLEGRDFAALEILNVVQNSAKRNTA